MPDGEANQTASVPATPKTPRTRKTAPKESAKKRKRDAEVTSDEEAETDDRLKEEA
jgi:hypothetical protein